MSIEQDGFLSPIDIDRVRTQYRQEFPKIFGFITEFNQLAQSLVPSITGQKRTLKNLFVSGYFIRGLQNCQAAVLMAERGLFTEAYTLARSGLETVFYLGAAIRGKDFAREMGQDHVKRTKVMGEDHIVGLKEMDPNANVGDLKTAIDDMMEHGIDPAPLYIQAVSRKAELEPLYKTLYRQLSNGHAHPTLSSLNIVWENDEEGLPHNVLWGPHRGRSDELVSALVIVVVIYNQLLLEWLREFKNQAAFDKLDEIGKRYTVFLKVWNGGNK